MPYFHYQIRSKCTHSGNSYAGLRGPVCCSQCYLVCELLLPLTGYFPKMVGDIHPKIIFEPVSIDSTNRIIARGTHRSCNSRLHTHCQRQFRNDKRSKGQPTKEKKGANLGE